MLAASTGKGKLAFDLGESCATSPTRTDNIQLRRLALYPVELRAHGLGHRVLVREEEAAAARSLLALTRAPSKVCNGDPSGHSARRAFVRRRLRNGPE